MELRPCPRCPMWASAQPRGLQAPEDGVPHSPAGRHLGRGPDRSEPLAGLHTQCQEVAEPGGGGASIRLEESFQETEGHAASFWRNL